MQPKKIKKIEDRRGEYEGEVEQVNGRDQKQGYGVMEFKQPHDDGYVTYSGDWMNNERNRYGKMKFSDGRVYKGYWTGGMMRGNGTMYYPNGDIYEGSWQSNCKHGKGTLTKANGEVWEQEWKGDELITEKKINTISPYSSVSQNLTVTYQTDDLSKPSIPETQSVSNDPSFSGKLTEPKPTLTDDVQDLLNRANNLIKPKEPPLILNKTKQEEESKTQEEKEIPAMLKPDKQKDDNGVEYFVGIKDDQGQYVQGKLHFEGGWYYVGKFQNGLPHDEHGLLSHPNGFDYFGPFINGVMDGEFILRKQNGDDGEEVKQSWENGECKFQKPPFERYDLEIVDKVSNIVFLKQIQQTRQGGPVEFKKMNKSQHIAAWIESCNFSQPEVKQDKITFSQPEVKQDKITLKMTQQQFIDSLKSKKPSNDFPQFEGDKDAQGNFMQGKITFAENVFYEGKFENNLPHDAYGKFVCDEYEYEGPFVDGKKHGKGLLKKGKDTYEVIFFQDELVTINFLGNAEEFMSNARFSIVNSNPEITPSVTIRSVMDRQIVKQNATFFEQRSEYIKDIKQMPVEQLLILEDNDYSKLINKLSDLQSNEGMVFDVQIPMSQKEHHAFAMMARKGSNGFLTVTIIDNGPTKNSLGGLNCPMEVPFVSTFENELESKLPGQYLVRKTSIPVTDNDVKKTSVDKSKPTISSVNYNNGEGTCGLHSLLAKLVLKEIYDACDRKVKEALFKNKNKIFNHNNKTACVNIVHLRDLYLKDRPQYEKELTAVAIVKLEKFLSRSKAGKKPLDDSSYRNARLITGYVAEKNKWDHSSHAEEPIKFRDTLASLIDVQRNMNDYQKIGSDYVQKIQEYNIRQSVDVMGVR